MDKETIRKKARIYYQKNREVQKKRKLDYYYKNREKIRAKRIWLRKNGLLIKTPNFFYHRHKGRAASGNHEFKLTFAEFELFWKKPCTYCGDDVETIGLDRVDNLKGYLIENVVSCCRPCNLMKKNYTLEDFIKRCKRIVSRSVDKN